MTNASANRLSDLLFIRSARSCTGAEQIVADELSGQRCAEIMAMGTPSGDELAELDNLISIFA